MVKPKHFGSLAELELSPWYQSISHVRMVDTANNKSYHIPIEIYRKMEGKTYEEQMAVLARYRLDPNWGRFILVGSLRYPY